MKVLRKSHMDEDEKKARMTGTAEKNDKINDFLKDEDDWSIKSRTEQFKLFTVCICFSKFFLL